MNKLFYLTILTLMSIIVCPAVVAQETTNAKTQQMLQQIKVLQNQETNKTSNQAVPTPSAQAAQPAQAPSQQPSNQGTSIPANASLSNNALAQQLAQEQAKIAEYEAQVQASQQQPRHVQQKTPSFNFPFAKYQLAKNPAEQAMHQQAFSGAVTNLLPMTPTQIHHLKQLYSSSQFAAAMPAGIPPRPVSTSLFVNLSPGSAPPAIRLSEGFISSLVFLDSTGAPWPIAAYDLGNPTAFNIAWDKKQNVLMIQAKSLYTYGNLAVQLRGLNTPIMLTLIPGQAVVDYRVDITVPGYGPEAKALPIDSSLPPQATPLLLNVLDGIAPKGSKTLTVTGGIGKVWLLNGKLYLRTRYTLLSPGWLATMSSADGTNAYELQKTPLLLVAKNGKVEHIKVEGF